jgi:hypothetical protein
MFKSKGSLYIISLVHSSFLKQNGTFSKIFIYVCQYVETENKQFSSKNLI